MLLTGRLEGLILRNTSIPFEVLDLLILNYFELLKL